MDEFKVTITGPGAGPRIVTYPEAPPPPIELIEQRGGQRVTVETCRALEFSTIDPAGDSEAAELVRWLWKHAGDTTNVSARWNGWQAATWIATNDLAVVARLASPIEFRVRDGGRRTLHARTVEACLRWEIATGYCRCGVDRDGGFCLCLDLAYNKLNAELRAPPLGKNAMHEGPLIELGPQSLEAVNRENAKAALFASRQVVGKFTASKPRGAPPGSGVHQSNDAALASMILKQVEAGEFPNRGQAINAVLDRVPGNSDAAKRKRLYRAMAKIEKGQ
jgi:hypothetical protein